MACIIGVVFWGKVCCNHDKELQSTISNPKVVVAAISPRLRSYMRSISTTRPLEPKNIHDMVHKP